jgi:hypothetical protein
MGHPRAPAPTVVAQSLSRPFPRFESEPSFFFTSSVFDGDGGDYHGNHFSLQSHPIGIGDIAPTSLVHKKTPVSTATPPDIPDHRIAPHNGITKTRSTIISIHTPNTFTLEPTRPPTSPMQIPDCM